MSAVEHRVIIVYDTGDANKYLNDGWLVKSVTPQWVSGHDTIVGGFLVVLERSKF